MPTLYDILGVQQNAEPETLRQAYRQLAHRYHPDINPDPRSHDLMARINDAFATLIDPDRRLEYDSMLTGGPATEPSTAPKKPIQVRLVRRLKSHRTPIYAITFAPDTGQMVTSSFDNEILWWDGELNEPVRRAKVESGAVSTIRALAGDRVVAAGAVETMVSMWEINQGRIMGQKASDQEWVSSVAISHAGDQTASVSIHRALGIHTVATGSLRLEREGHDQSVTAVAWSTDDRMIATGAADNTIKLWNAANGDLIDTFGAVRSAITALAFSPDGEFLAAAAVDLSIRVFNVKKGTLEKMMFGHTKPIEALAFHPNGWLFASCGRDGSVKLWNADKGLGQLHIDVSTSPLLHLAFSQDGKFLAAGGLDKIVRVWEISVKGDL